MNRIGIDVGGTNTDAVLMEGTSVIAAVKTPTTDDVMRGIVEALRLLAERANMQRVSVDAAMIGTTHFTNAVVRRRDLSKVAAVRVGLPASASLPPFVDWPLDLAHLVRGEVFQLRGGHEYDGKPIVPFDEPAMYDCAARIRDSGITCVGVSSVFSPLTSECEDRVEEILRDTVPNVSVTKSCTLGRIGLLERENATLLNACLVPLAQRTFNAFASALVEAGLETTLFISQNDGTVMDTDFAKQYPVLSFASGPTNSMRGAAALSGVSNALVADVGGTTTDIGCLVSGFPREANNAVEIGGVRTAFRMPDLLSVGLGGGSIVRLDMGTIGPDSVGHEIREKAKVFGGDVFTTTDVAVATGRATIGDVRRLHDLSSSEWKTLLDEVHEILIAKIDQMKTSAADETLIAVGGAAFLVPEKLPGIDRVLRVRHADVANAVGAALAQISGEADQIFTNVGRRQAIACAEDTARQRAIAAGASANSLTLVDVDDIPVSYLPGDARRVRVRVVGDIVQNTVAPTNDAS